MFKYSNWDIWVNLVPKNCLREDINPWLYKWWIFDSNILLINLKINLHICIWESNCFVIDNISEPDEELTVPFVETSPSSSLEFLDLKPWEWYIFLDLLKLN